MQPLIRCRLVRSLDPPDLSEQNDVEILAIPRIGEIVMPNLSGTAKKYQVKQVVYAGRHHSVPAEVVLVVEEVSTAGAGAKVSARVVG